MTRFLTTLAAVALAATAAHAEPIFPVPGWSYSVEFKPADGASTILLNDSVYSQNRYVTYSGNLSAWPVTTDYIYPRTYPFTFGLGAAEVSNIPPAAGTYALNAFDLYWKFTDKSGASQAGTARGKAYGSISSPDDDPRWPMRTFWLSLDSDNLVVLNGVQARVKFGIVDGRTDSGFPLTSIFVDVERVEQPLATPEPATLVLAGIGLAGLVGRRLRRRSA